MGRLGTGIGRVRGTRARLGRLLRLMAAGVTLGASMAAVAALGAIEPAAAAAKPTTTTDPAVSITPTSAVFTGTVDPNGSATALEFDYGTSTTYTNKLISLKKYTGTSTIAVAAKANNLTPGIEYDFRLKATNGVGTTTGGNQAFITPPAPPTNAVSAAYDTSLTSNPSVTNDGVTVAGQGPGAITVAQYASNPGPAATFGSAGEYFDVQTSTDNAFTSVTIEDCNLNGGHSLVWLDSGTWQPVVGDPGPLFSGGSPPCLSTVLNGHTSPAMNRLSGTVFAVSGPTTSGPQQLFGFDAIGTAIAVSEAEFPSAGSASAVVLARSDFFADALAGGPLAAFVGGPLLITPGAALSPGIDPRVLAEIERVLPVGATVYVLGGDLALAPGIDAALSAAGYSVVRVFGQDEYATAVAIAEQMGNPPTIFEATGLAFYDALSAVPAAIADHGAILLTDGNVQTLATGLYLLAHPSDARYAIGGPEAAYGADPTATPVYGLDHFGTSAAIATVFFPAATIFGAASSADFPDALAGGVFMATDGRLGPILLVNPTLPLPVPISTYLGYLSAGAQGFVFGGPDAVTPGVVSALQAAVG
jgi:hypothetical protein